MYLPTRRFLNGSKEVFTEITFTSNNCSTEDLISNHKDMILNYNGYTKAKLFIGDSYFYNNRMFCKETISFTNFISKVKNYYKNKLKKYKSIKYLEHRRLFGKYPTIKK